MKSILLTLLLFIITATALSQTHKNKSIAVKIKQLKTLLDESGNMSPEMTDSLDINNKIKTQLTEILLTPQIKNYDLEKTFNGSIEITHSKDKQLWFFTWYENTGGSFKSNLTVIYYKTKANKTGVENEFDSTGASYDQIIKLPSKSKNLYLCLGGVVGCNTCSASVATVIELTTKGINLDYPAFEVISNNSWGGKVTVSKPTFVMDSRVDDIKVFEYDAKTQSIRYSYVPDDNTPISIDMETYNPDAKPIKGHFKWNGTRFVGSTAGGHE